MTVCLSPFGLLFRADSVPGPADFCDSGNIGCRFCHRLAAAGSGSWNGVGGGRGGVIGSEKRGGDWEGAAAGLGEKCGREVTDTESIIQIKCDF